MELQNPLCLKSDRLSHVVDWSSDRQKLYQPQNMSTKVSSRRNAQADFFFFFCIIFGFFFLSSLPVAHVSDAPRRRLVVTGDNSRI